MTKTIYVGNLPYSTNEAEIRGLFEEFGTVESIRMIMDRDTGRPKGFGFVEMESDEAGRAIEKLNGRELGGRSLRINAAEERQDRPQRKSW